MAKRAERIASNKPQVILDLVNRHPGEQVIVWTCYDEEGRILAETIPGSVHIFGKTAEKERERIIEEFRLGQLRVLITKPKLMGYGLNLQFCSVQIWSGISDSFEQLYQGIKRSHRYGATKQLYVYLPVTHLEEPLLRNVLAKKATFEADARYQEDLYIESLAQELQDYVDQPGVVVKAKEPREPMIPERVRQWFERGPNIAS